MAMAIARILLSILVYILICIGIVASKPSFLFTETGAFKTPGLAQDGRHSIMAAAVFFPLLAAMIYYIVAIIMLSFT